MNVNKIINIKNFEKILTIIIIFLFSISAFEFTQKRWAPQETDDRYAYELKATHFKECFLSKDCIGLNSFPKFILDKTIVNYNSIRKENRDTQRILYSYHPFYSHLEIFFKKFFNKYSKLALILSVNLFALLSIYKLCINFFNKKVFYFSSIILFFNPLFPGLISGYPFILSTSFAIFSLINFQKRNFFLFYLTIVLASLSHIFGLLFIFFFIILNYINFFLIQKSIIQTIKNLKLHFINLILLLIFFLIYFFPINFTNTSLIKGSNFIELSYLKSYDKLVELMMRKASIIFEFFESFYLLSPILLNTVFILISGLIILFLTNFKNLNNNLKSILISLLVFFIILMLFPNVLIIERFVPFYSIILISVLSYSILKIKRYKKIGFYLLNLYCILSILSGSNYLYSKKLQYQNYSDLFMDEYKIKEYAKSENNLFLFNSNEALFYKFLISGLQKKNYFINVKNANVNLKNINVKFENIYLVSDNKLVDINKNNLTSNSNKKIKILSNNKKINKIILFSFEDTIVKINNKNFKLVSNKFSELLLNNKNKLEIKSDDKIYILKFFDDKNKVIYDYDILINNKRVNRNQIEIENKIVNFKKNNCEIKLYDVMFAGVIYKLKCK